MAHIDLGVDEAAFPGIVGLMRFRPEAAKPMAELVDVLLRGPSSLSPGERELIAAYVSALNECSFCRDSHAAMAAEQLPEGRSLVSRVLDDLDSAPVSPKLRALLRIAGAVQQSGRLVTPEMVADARAEGASDLELHDTVLITGAFALANRYVDGLGAFTPQDPELYEGIAKVLVHTGYGAALAPQSENA
jgi:uncharacterized peroxidase-related enzyme